MTETREEHHCAFDWCDVNWNDQQDHWGMEYTSASLRGGDPHHLPSTCEPLRVGIGVSYSEGEAETPAIVVHIDGGRGDTDADAHLKITEAVALRERLDVCIRSAVEAFRHMAAEVLSAAPDDAQPENVPGGDAINERFPGPFQNLDLSAARHLSVTVGAMEDDGCNITEAVVWRVRYDMYAPYCEVCDEGGGMHIAGCPNLDETP